MVSYRIWDTQKIHHHERPPRLRCDPPLLTKNSLNITSETKKATLNTKRGQKGRGDRPAKYEGQYPLITHRIFA